MEFDSSSTKYWTLVSATSKWIKCACATVYLNLNLLIIFNCVVSYTYNDNHNHACLLFIYAGQVPGLLPRSRTRHFNIPGSRSELRTAAVVELLLLMTNNADQLNSTELTCRNNDNNIVGPDLKLAPILMIFMLLTRQLLI